MHTHIIYYKKLAHMNMDSKVPQSAACKLETQKSWWWCSDNWRTDGVGLGQMQKTDDTAQAVRQRE